MSRPQKLHKPLKANFNSVLGAVAIGTGKAKHAAIKAAREHKSGGAKIPKK